MTRIRDSGKEPTVETEKPKCPVCKDKKRVVYYHDAGDHFSAGPSPHSEWREKPCSLCCRE